MSTKVTLSNIPLEIDPEDYQFLAGTRRGSVHQLLNGATVFQDRGIRINDMTISFSGKIIKKTTLSQLWALYQTTGVSFTFSDYEDNVFTVLFTPGQESFAVTKEKGSQLSYDYTIKLSVLAWTKQFGVVVT